MKRLHEEVAYVAYHLHWPRDQILELEHLERQRWVQEVAELVRRAEQASDAAAAALR